jgi:serine/threonine-protein kinase
MHPKPQGGDPGTASRAEQETLPESAAAPPAGGPDPADRPGSPRGRGAELAAAGADAPRRTAVQAPSYAPFRARVSASFRNGTVLERVYRVEDRVAEGAMGVVLRARDLRLDRDVALKVIRTDLDARLDAQARFLREARTMARIKHPNVVEVYALGEHEGLPFIVMEYVSGMALDEWLSLRGDRPVGVDEAIAILDPICLGLSAIHAAGVAHRDVKAGNILVGPGFRIVVADLGLTSGLVAGGASRGSGTPATMAPEVVAGTVVDPKGYERADVYSLGVLAYRILVGRYPFEGRGGPEVMRAHVEEPVPPPRSIRHDLPEAFEHVLLHALEKDPARRTPTVARFREELHAAREAQRRGRSALRFLVVDDDAEFRGMVARLLALQFPGAVVEQAADGVAALDAAAAHPPSVIVTDLDMPRMNGLELVTALRGSPGLARVPVVVVTGTGSGRDWKVLKEVGADAFLVKPFDALHAAALVRALVERRAAGPMERS